MIEIRKTWYEDTETYMIDLLSDYQRIRMCFHGNLDLYWSYYDNKPFDFDSVNNEKTFEITKGNYFIYSLFDQLYSGIKFCNIYLVSQDDSNMRLNEQARRSGEYSMLFNSGAIKWLSDELPEGEANSFAIVKSEDSFIITFAQKDNMIRHYSVRISNSGSRYNPFNIIFMRMFNALQEYDDTYHQTHIEEYMYKKKC